MYALLVKLTILLTALAGLLMPPSTEETLGGIQLGAIEPDLSQLTAMTSEERADFKGVEVAKISSIPKTQRGNFQIEVSSITAIERGVGFYARVWENGVPVSLGIGVETERFVIINPPLFVNDPLGTKVKSYTDEKGLHERRLRLDPKEALLQVLEHVISRTGKGFNPPAGSMGHTTTVVFADQDVSILGASPDTNQNAASVLHIGDNAGGDKARDLLTFTFPAGTDNFDSAELSLFQEDVQGDDVGLTTNLHHGTSTIATAWIDNVTTWNNYVTSTPWTAGGAASDFSSTVVDSNALVNKAASLSTYLQWALIQASSTNPMSLTWATTYDFFVRAPTSAGSQAKFSDTETAGTTQDPKITIVHSAAAGGAAAPTRRVYILQ